MSILLENRIWYGINLGFELFCPDDFFDEYQLEINILILKITLLWQR